MINKREVDLRKCLRTCSEKEQNRSVGGWITVKRLLIVSVMSATYYEAAATQEALQAKWLEIKQRSEQRKQEELNKRVSEPQQPQPQDSASGQNRLGSKGGTPKSNSNSLLSELENKFKVKIPQNPQSEKEETKEKAPQQKTPLELVSELERDPSWLAADFLEEVEKNANSVLEWISEAQNGTLTDEQWKKVRTQKRQLQAQEQKVVQALIGGKSAEQEAWSILLKRRELQPTQSVNSKTLEDRAAPFSQKADIVKGLVSADQSIAEARRRELIQKIENQVTKVNKHTHKARCTVEKWFLDGRPSYRQTAGLPKIEHPSVITLPEEVKRKADTIRSSNTETWPRIALPPDGSAPLTPNSTKSSVAGSAPAITKSGKPSSTLPNFIGRPSVPEPYTYGAKRQQPIASSAAGTNPKVDASSGGVHAVQSPAFVKSLPSTEQANSAPTAPPACQFSTTAGAHLGNQDSRKSPPNTAPVAPVPQSSTKTTGYSPAVEPRKSLSSNTLPAPVKVPNSSPSSAPAEERKTYSFSSSTQPRSILGAPENKPSSTSNKPGQRREPIPGVAFGIPPESAPKKAIRHQVPPFPSPSAGSKSPYSLFEPNTETSSKGTDWESILSSIPSGVASQQGKMGGQEGIGESSKEPKELSAKSSSTTKILVDEDTLSTNSKASPKLSLPQIAHQVAYANQPSPQAVSTHPTNPLIHPSNRVTDWDMWISSHQSSVASQQGKMGGQEGIGESNEEPSDLSVTSSSIARVLVGERSLATNSKASPKSSLPLIAHHVTYAKQPSPQSVNTHPTNPPIHPSYRATDWDKSFSSHQSRVASLQGKKKGQEGIGEPNENPNDLSVTSRSITRARVGESTQSTNSKASPESSLPLIAHQVAYAKQPSPQSVSTHSANPLIQPNIMLTDWDKLSSSHQTSVASQQGKLGGQTGLGMVNSKPRDNSENHNSRTETPGERQLSTSNIKTSSVPLPPTMASNVQASVVSYTSRVPTPPPLILDPQISSVPAAPPLSGTESATTLLSPGSAPPPPPYSVSASQETQEEATSNERKSPPPPLPTTGLVTQADGNQRNNLLGEIQSFSIDMLRRSTSGGGKVAATGGGSNQIINKDTAKLRYPTPESINKSNLLPTEKFTAQGLINRLSLVGGLEELRDQESRTGREGLDPRFWIDEQQAR